MEEDNADDIIKWLFKEGLPLDCRGYVEMGTEEGARQIRWEARLRGNLLALKPVDQVTEPLLFVCEKMEIGKLANGLGLRLKQNNREMEMVVASEAELDEWLFKLSTCSHRIAKAEYDQILCAHYSHPASADAASPASPLGYFLTSPITKEQNFSLFQSANVPNKHICCREAMHESKLSMLMPGQALKLSAKWTAQLRDELLEKLWRVRNASMVDTLHMAVRHLNSNIEIHTQASEFLDAYTGPSFRPSTEKYRVSFLYVPTNLHVQLFSINDKPAANFITAGALAALPLRFSHGGLYRLRNKFGSNSNPNFVDHTNEARLHGRHQMLAALKRKIGDLSRRIDTDWNAIGEGAGRDGIELFSEAKQIRETLADLIGSFPNIHNLVDSLCEGGLAQLQHSGSGEAVPRDTLANQLDLVEAQFDSLNSKVAALAADKADQQNEAERKSASENFRSSFNLALDALHHLTLSIEFAQMLSLVQCLRNRNDCQSFFHLQLRHDALMSQALTVTVTALLAAIYNDTSTSGASDHPAALSCWQHSDPLLTCFAFLSCYGDEQGMIEDAFEIWQLFPKIVSFKFITASSSVTQTCIPQIDGFRCDIKVSIPLHPDKLKALPAKLSSGEWFCPKIVFWNLGINHEASLAASVGDISLEETVNRTALKQITEFVLTSSQQFLAEEGSSYGGETTINRLLRDLQQTVATNASKKNMAIFSLAMALNTTLGGMCVLSCKSGKDRTSMAVTLEEGRILKETCGISNQQMHEIVECLRKSGVRRENCRKNVGKPLYSFSPFQMNFLPKEFRPPLGTFTNMVAS